MTEQLVEKFNKKVNEINTLTERPNNDEFLQLYAWFKQAKFGDCNNNRPGIFYFKERAKHDTWVCKKGKSKEEAMNEYINLVDKLLLKYEH